MIGFPRLPTQYEVQPQQQALRDKRARLSQALQAQAAANGVSNVMLNFSGARR
jgi:hypothetical protein